MTDGITLMQGWYADNLVFRIVVHKLLRVLHLEKDLGPYGLMMSPVQAQKADWQTAVTVSGETTTVDIMKMPESDVCDTAYILFVTECTFDYDRCQVNWFTLSKILYNEHFILIIR